MLNVLASPQSRCRAVSALIAEQRIETLRPVLENLDAPVYAAGQGVMDAVAGFPIHRGILALGEKPAEPDIADLLTAAPDDALVAAACGVGNHDNIGGIFRNAAAFGAHAVLLDAHCCDPLFGDQGRDGAAAGLGRGQHVQHHRPFRHEQAPAAGQVALADLAIVRHAGVV